MKGHCGYCDRCGKWDKDLRRFKYGGKDHGNVCRKCRNEITYPYTYWGNL